MTDESRPDENREYMEEERVAEHSGTSHSLAIGFYIAALVLIFGVTLVLVGLTSSGAAVEGNLGFNVNLWWGLVMVASGLVILGLTLASPRRRAEREARDR